MVRAKADLIPKLRRFKVYTISLVDVRPVSHHVNKLWHLTSHIFTLPRASISATVTRAKKFPPRFRRVHRSSETEIRRVIAPERAGAQLALSIPNSPLFTVLITPHKSNVRHTCSTT